MLLCRVAVTAAVDPVSEEPSGRTEISVVDAGASADAETVPSESAAKSGLPEALAQTKPKVEWSLSAAKLLWSVVVIVLAYYVIAFVSRILERIAERWVNLRLAVMRLIPFIRVLGWTGVMYVIVAGILAPPIETLLALTASAGIALGFSSQDILKNMFGGMMILMDRPFQAGDKIQIGDHYGEVIQIGLRSVRIVTPDDSVVSIPNSDIVNQPVSNANNGESNCQVVAELYLPLGLDFSVLKTIARRAAVVSRYIYLNKPIVVVFKNEIHEGRSLLKMRVKAYVLDIRYEFPFAGDMTELIVETLIRKNLLDDANPLTAPACLPTIMDTPHE
ncbi:mechanosensitive ion channel [Desulfatiferula olefinivorans]